MYVAVFNNFSVLISSFFIIELALDDRTPYLSVALFTFVSFLSGLCCIGILQMFVEKAFDDDEKDRGTYSSGVSVKN